MREDDVHSRSRLAGYNPELLSNSSMLVVGAGAIGQNLALDLALAGVGELALVDFDNFEGHNATRSPLYPTIEEQNCWGRGKARVVAHKLFTMMTASPRKIYYADVPIQALGDLPLIHTDIVLAAVDNQNARAYLAERCHVVGKPLVEAGILTGILNVAVFGSTMDDPCYRCQSPGKEGAYSCKLSALEAERHHVLPTIQNTAAVVAGLQAEASIQWLHGDRSLLNRRIHGDIRAMTMRVTQLVRSPLCPGVHWTESASAAPILDVGGDDTLGYLLKMVEKEVGFAQVRFPTQLVVRNSCAYCGALVDVYAPEWYWLQSPHCSGCGGFFAKAKGEESSPSRVGVYTDEDEADIVSLQCNRAGLPSGTLCEIWPIENRERLGERYLMRLKGTIDDLMQRVIVAPEIA